MLKDKIQEIFKRRELDPIVFPGGAFEVADEIGDGRPNLIVISYDAVTVGTVVEAVPDLIERIYSRKGSEGIAVRKLRNNLVFAVADEQGKEEMRRKAVRRLALQELKKPERLEDLADHQTSEGARARVQIRAGARDRDSAVLPPHLLPVAEPRRVERRRSRAHRDRHALGVRSTRSGAAPSRACAARPREAPALRRRALLAELRPRPHTAQEGADDNAGAARRVPRDPALPILIGDDIFIRGIRRGVDQGEYVYQRGDLLFGPGDPSASIAIDEDSVLFTMAFAKNSGIWPRKPKEPPKPDPG